MSGTNTNTYRKVTGADLLANLRVTESENVATDAVPRFRISFEDTVLVGDSLFLDGVSSSNDPQSLIDTGGVNDQLQLTPMKSGYAEFVGDTHFLTAVGRPEYYGRRLFVSSAITSVHGFVPVQPFIVGISEFGDG